MDIGVFPRPLGADAAAPAVILAVIGALAVEDVALVVEDVDPQFRIPMTVATWWRSETGGGAWQGFGRLVRRHRLAGSRRGLGLGGRARRRDRWQRAGVWSGLLDRTGA